jgi:hypothetical protein
MDDRSHAFLIKDKIRCIQKKIMDQLAADLNSALNDASILPSSLSGVPMASSSSSVTITKTKRRRKRAVNSDNQQPKIDLSDSTTPENSQNRNLSSKQSIVSDSDDMLMASSNLSTRNNPEMTAFFMLQRHSLRHLPQHRVPIRLRK